MPPSEDIHESREKSHMTEKTEKTEKTVAATEKKETKKKTAPTPAGRLHDQPSRWNEQTCIKFAKRFTSIEEWSSGHPSSYKAAQAKGWVQACIAKMQKPASAPRTLKKSA